MQRLVNISTSDIQEYINLGLMDDIIDPDFWKLSNKESQEIVLKNVGDVNESIKAIYYSPHDLSLKDIYRIDEIIKPHIIPLFYDILERGKVRICNIPESLDPSKLMPSYFYTHINYSSDQELQHLLPIMSYTIEEHSDIEEVIRLHKLGLGSVFLYTILYGTSILEIIRKLYNEGIILSSTSDIIYCCQHSENIIELLDMGYQLTGTTYINDYIQDPIVFERCRPYLCPSDIIKTCLRLRLPLPDDSRVTIYMTLDNLVELEEYSKRYDIRALDIHITYNGEYCMSPLFNLYRMTIENINLANWIKEVYPEAPIIINKYPCDEDILPPVEYHVKGAITIIPHIYKYPKLLKYYVDHYGDKINIRMNNNDKYFINC